MAVKASEGKRSAKFDTETHTG
ncbi:MAG: hypothetical protein QOD97_356, partial [Mycobacterium sp.]|nr:hypothetical protein [Mycobacterium sp.]